MKREKVPQPDDVSYREYLLHVVNDHVTVPVGQPGIDTVMPTPAQRMHQTLDEVDALFKQDFKTVDNSVIGASVVPIEVISRVLVEDLGFAAASIPVRQSETDQQYLDSLVALSGQDKAALESTYCIDLTRSGLETTTRVRENILTLQAHLRDGKFDPKVNPFFHYKEEWRLRYRTPFYPENHYGLKTGIFASQGDRSRCLTLIDLIEKDENYKKASQESAFIARIRLLLIADQKLNAGHRQYLAEEYGLALSDYQSVSRAIQQVCRKMHMKIYVLPADGHTIKEASYSPAVTSAKGFRSSLDPSNRVNLFPNQKVFGSNPHWGGPYWPDRWKKGLKSGHWDPLDMPNSVPKNFPFTTYLFKRLKWRYDSRAGFKVASSAGLEKLHTLNTVKVEGADTSANYHDKVEKLYELHDDLLSAIPHVMFLLLPVCFGDIAESRGDSVRACQKYGLVTQEELLRGLLSSKPGSTPEYHGDLPWSRDSEPYAFVLNAEDYPYLNKDCERPYLLLRIGKMHLGWADQLYRADQEADVFRARELYKSVLTQYGIDPVPGKGLAPLPIRIAQPPVTRGYTLPANFGDQPLQPVGTVSSNSEAVPNWTRETAEGVNVGRGIEAPFEAAGIHTLGEEVEQLDPATRLAWSPLIEAGIPPISFVEVMEVEEAQIFPSITAIPMLIPAINPAILAQQMRARIGLTQIDAGLNYFGYGHFLVPLLRYRPLAATAQRFSALSKQAESDFLDYKTNAEKGELALIQARSAVAAAAISVEIEGERIIQAKDYVFQAEVQVKQVNDAIAAKQAEINDHADICGQVADFASGIKDFFGGVPEKATKYVKSDYSAAFGFSTLKAGTTAGLGVVGGIGLFAVGAGVTVSGMADAANARLSELDTLKKEQLPMAMAALDARKRELSISQMRKSVAILEVLTAQEILRHSLLKTLNADLWTQMGITMKSVLRRYLDLGTMTGWLAERSLAYAQDRDLRVIRLDYFDRRRHGLLGADMLQSDLATLDQEYITGKQQTTAVKWTLSLAKEFPLQFGQLKKNSRTSFITNSAHFDRAYPGSFGHRIKTLEVKPVIPVTEPIPVGLLSNPGVSRVQESSLAKWHFVVRNPDVMPLSGFSIENDMAIYQLPGETLLPFEGSGMETLWTLEFPAEANPAGLAALADIELTFFLESRFSAARRNELAIQQPAPQARTVLLSAKQLFGASLQTFQQGGDSDLLDFDVKHALLESSDQQYKVTNVGVFFIGDGLPEIKASLKSDDNTVGAKFTTSNNLSHSNKLPAPANYPVPTSPLDAMVSGPPNQNWRLQVLATDNAGLGRKRIKDVILGVEYV